MGDEDHGVTRTGGEKGEQRGPGSGEQPPFVCLPEASCPIPLLSPRPPLTEGSIRLSARPPLRGRLPTSNMAARASLRGGAEPAVLARAAHGGIYPA